MHSLVPPHGGLIRLSNEPRGRYPDFDPDFAMHEMSPVWNRPQGPPCASRRLRETLSEVLFPPPVVPCL
jgi:hypothetical protein